MSSLAERQNRFAAAILDATLPVPAGLFGPDGADHVARFAVYRNNVAVGLIEALRAAFPVVNRLVGDEFFAAMARAHASRCPPSSPVLLAYGGDFPAFVADFAPARALPYLADVASLEWHWLETYHAAEAEPLAIEDLQAVPADRLPGLRLSLHPSARFLSFAHPALTIWNLHRAEDEPAALEIGDNPEEILLVRPQAHVEATRLPKGALPFFEAVHAGGTIAEAAEAALEEEPGTAIAALLPLLFGAGAFAGFVDPAASGQGDPA